MDHVLSEPRRHRSAGARSGFACTGPASEATVSITNADVCNVLITMTVYRRSLELVFRSTNTLDPSITVSNTRVQLIEENRKREKKEYP